MIPLGIVASSKVATTGDSAATTALRQYVAGDVPYESSPQSARGQPEILTPNSPLPESVVFH